MLDFDSAYSIDLEFNETRGVIDSFLDMFHVTLGEDGTSIYDSQGNKVGSGCINPTTEDYTFSFSSTLGYVNASVPTSIAEFNSTCTEMLCEESIIFDIRKEKTSEKKEIVGTVTTEASFTESDSFATTDVRLFHYRGNNTVHELHFGKDKNQFHFNVYTGVSSLESIPTALGIVPITSFKVKYNCQECSYHGMVVDNGRIQEVTVSSKGYEPGKDDRVKQENVVLESVSPTGATTNKTLSTETDFGSLGDFKFLVATLNQTPIGSRVLGTVHEEAASLSVGGCSLFDNCLYHATRKYGKEMMCSFLLRETGDYTSPTMLNYIKDYLSFKTVKSRLVSSRGFSFKKAGNLS